jgi:hypothetical protein
MLDTKLYRIGRDVLHQVGFMCVLFANINTENLYRVNNTVS